MPDLGQTRCINDFKKTINPLINNSYINNIIVSAHSQGTATIINWLSHNKNEKVKLVILEAVIGSGNSAVSHTVENFIFPAVSWLPFSYYWLPYVAIFHYPCYAPAGEQPILNVENVDKNIPFIILHSKFDPQLSINDARAIAHALKQNGNPVYLIEKNTYKHVNLINEQNNIDISEINSIIQQHGLGKQKTISSPNSPQPYTYQKEHEIAYEQLITQEKRMWWFDLSAKELALCAFMYTAYKYLKPIAKIVGI